MYIMQCNTYSTKSRFQQTWMEILKLIFFSHSQARILRVTDSPNIFSSPMEFVEYVLHCICFWTYKSHYAFVYVCTRSESVGMLKEERMRCTLYLVILLVYYHHWYQLLKGIYSPSFFLGSIIIIGLLVEGLG